MNEEFGRKVVPFLKSEYFQDQAEKLIFGLIKEYADKYNKFPTKEALAIDLANRDAISEDTFTKCKNINFRPVF